MMFWSGGAFEVDGGGEADLRGWVWFSDIIGVHPIFGGFLVG